MTKIIGQIKVGALLKKALRFEPANDSSPRDIFTYDAFDLASGAGMPMSGLYFRRDDPRDILVFVVGCSINHTDINGTTARAGCAWFFKPPPLPFDLRSSSIRLEQEGPWSHEHPQTSDRAELRATIGALQHGFWYELGFNNVVIASSSDYLVLGITLWIKNWRAHGWRDASGTVIENQDLWKVLLCEISRYSHMGTNVLFWKISDDENTEARVAATSAAYTKPNVKQYTGIVRTT